MGDAISAAGHRHIVAPVLRLLLRPFGCPECDPDISRKDIQAIRRLVRSLPLISGPLLSVWRADSDQRPDGCGEAEVFVVMTGGTPGPLCGRGERLVIVKQDDGSMILADRRHWVS